MLVSSEAVLVIVWAVATVVGLVVGLLVVVVAVVGSVDGITIGNVVVVVVVIAGAFIVLGVSDDRMMVSLSLSDPYTSSP